ncbi:SNase-domain-containing protein [Durotheca rogersii]|uniref:SNase-domain-containing protein n=1 Tax=Durotheca rogersii TaxID=419775 RepID=UPI0022200551|nr:SNase-domain-containing protein [Durotheca rogersii]KAI5862121.1 SNase-domain-containing protein [Durotheca rogersii]
MGWPSTSDSGKNSKNDDSSRRPVSWPDSLNGTDWEHYKDPRNWVLTLLVTTTTLVSLQVYRSYLRRIPGTTHIQPSFFRKRSLFGRVTSVGDGDNFHLYHTPGGRLAGWDWLRKVPVKKTELKNKTIPIRIAGVDAPEGAHFGHPAQPFSSEALTWLSDYLLGRRVRVLIYRRDHYDRIVGTVYVRRFLTRQDVGLEMLKRGLATTYEAKTGAEFGGLEEEYKAAESIAKTRKLGIWGGKKKAFESPRDYKTRMNVGEPQNGNGKTKA